MPAITSANLAQAIVNLVATKGLTPLVGALTLGNLVNRDFEPVLGNVGATINVPIPPPMIANNLAEGGSVQTQNPNLGNAQITIDTHAEASFTIPDVSRAMAQEGLIEMYMQPAINAIAERVETDILALNSTFTANTPLGAYNTALTEATIDNAETALFNAKVPMLEEKYLILEPNTYGVVRQLPRFSEYRTAEQAGLNALLLGQVGRMKSFYVFRSQFVPKSGSNTTNIAFHRNSTALVIRRLPMPIPGTGAIAQYAEAGGFGFRVVMSYNPNTLAQQFTVDINYGVGILRNNHAVQVRS
jgi:hypothetical protein